MNATSVQRPQKAENGVSKTFCLGATQGLHLARRRGWPQGASEAPAFPPSVQASLFAGAVEKNARTLEADQECLQLLAILFTGFGTGNSCFK